jgi:hypothetical protein
VPTRSGGSGRQGGLPGLDVRGDGGYAIFHGANGVAAYEAVADHPPYQISELAPELEELLHGQIIDARRRATNACLVGIDELLARALEEARTGRNNAGFGFVCQLRDHGYSASQALGVAQRFVRSVGVLNAKGNEEPYTIDEYQRSVKQAFTRQPREPWHPLREAERVDAIPVSAVARTDVDWLWSGRIPLGAVSLLVGDPGLGKSLLACRLAANVSLGKIGEGSGNTLIISAEDSYGAVVRPRLEAAGADLDRVFVPQLVRDGVEDCIALPDDVATLEQ